MKTLKTLINKMMSLRGSRATVAISEIASPAVRNDKNNAIKRWRLGLVVVMAMLLVGCNPPKVTVTSPTEGQVVADVMVDVLGTVTDAQGQQDIVAVIVNETTAVINGQQFSVENLPLLNEGENTIQVQAKDKSNNVTTVTVTVIRQLDAPTISITSPTDGTWVGQGQVTVTGNVTDATSVTVNGQSASINGNTFSATINVIAGQNTITAVASNGGQTAQASIQLFYDNTPPTVFVVSDDGDLTHSSDTLHFAWTTSTDGESGIDHYEYAIGTSEGGTSVRDFTTIANPEAGELTATGLALFHNLTYYVTVRAVNGASLMTDRYSDGIQTNLNIPTLLSFIPDDLARFEIGEDLMLEAEGQDADGDALQYQFKIDDDIVSAYSSDSTASLELDPSYFGRRTLSVTVRDSFGSESQPTAHEVFIFRKPIEG